VERVDPFDGGPHFEARLEDLTPVRGFRTAKLHPEALVREADDMLVAVERAVGRNRFRAVRCQARLDDRFAYLPAQAKELLSVDPGDKLSLIPFE
jgi:arginine N-succinyltransferase